MARTMAARENIERVAGLASTRLAHALIGVDRVRAAVSRRGEAPADLGPAPESVLAVIAHWRPGTPERLPYVEQCVRGVLALSARQVVAVVLTNEPGPAARELAERLGPVPVRVAEAAEVPAAAGEREVLVVGWRPGLRHRHGFYLTWGHVPILRAAARGGRFSHLAYLEDDMRLTDAHLRYWSRYRRPLAAHGLLPGLVRFEEREGERYLVDALYPLDPALRRRVVEVDGAPVAFVNLANPYQALYILDPALAATHFRFSRGRTPLRSRASEWAVRERAASGPIFDDVPEGLVSRNVVPVHMEGGRQRLDPDCLIEHMAPTHSSSASPFGNVRVDELFQARAGAPVSSG